MHGIEMFISGFEIDKSTTVFFKYSKYYIESEIYINEITVLIT